MAVKLMYRIDIGFDPERGYGAAIFDPIDGKQKGIKAANIRQLCRSIHEAICEDEQKKRRFPLERETGGHIITKGQDPLFDQL